MIPAVVVTILTLVLARRNMFWACLFMLGLNQVDFLFPELQGWSFGRIAGVVLIVGVALPRALRGYTGLGIGTQKKILVPIVGFVAVGIAGLLNCRDVPAGISLLVRVGALGLTSVLIALTLKTRKDALWMVRVLGTTALVSVAVASYQAVSGATEIGGQELGIDESETGARFSGTSRNANGLGLSVAGALPFALAAFGMERKTWIKGAWLGVMGALAYGLLLSASRTNIVNVAITLATFTAISSDGRTGLKKRLAPALAIVAVVFALAAGPGAFAIRRMTETSLDEDGSSRYRILSIEKTVELVRETPLLGIGLRQFKFHSPRGGGFDVHDSFSALVGETGLLGAFCFVAIVVNSLRALWRARGRARKRGDSEMFLLVCAVFSGVSGFVGASYGSVITVERFFWVAVGVSLVVSASGGREGARRPNVAGQVEVPRRFAPLTLPAGRQRW